MNRLLISCTALAVLAGGASAATIKAKQTGLAQNSGSYKLYFGGNQTPGHNVGAGAINHTVAGDSQTWANAQLRLFCIDINQSTQNQFNTFQIGSVADAPDPDAPTGNIGSLRAGFLGSLYYNAIQAGLLNNRGSATDAMTNQQAAAFQLVVWELAFEDSGNLAAASGDNSSWASLLATDQFIATQGNGNAVGGAIATNALTFFGWAFNGDAFGQLRAITSQTAQDQLIVIPLPTGGVMALAGLVGIAGVRRRR
jgi:hypothetical protein